MNTTSKLSLASAALLVAGSVFAQGTPPNPNVANPALGAGQQTQQGTSMGTTGVPTEAPAAPAVPAAQSAPAAPAAAPAPAAPMDPAPMRPARADRN